MSDESEHKHQLTRREFFKGAGAAGAASMLAGYAMIDAAHAQAPEYQVPETWDYETDVLVIGFGGAGAAAAIEAADNGAQVMILEKQEEATHYPNTRMSGGIFHSPSPDGDRKALVQYLLAMFSGGNLPWKLEAEQPRFGEQIATAFADYEVQNLDWLQGLDPDIKFVKRGGAAFPNFPGAEASQYATYFSTMTGRPSFDKPTVDAPKLEKQNGEALFYVLSHAATDKGAEVKYQTRAKQLVVSGGQVLGAIADENGTEKSFKARKAVVLTAGGYEYSRDMRLAFLEGPGLHWAFYGTPHNTGDGIEMALDIGVQPAKVGKAASRIIMAVPVMFHDLKAGVITPAVGQKGEIVVDNYGKRYAAENMVTDDPSRYFFYKEAVQFDIINLVYPRVPSWMIFDQTLMTAGPLTYMGLSTVGFGYVPWSEDNKQALDKGWILQGDTIEALGEAIKGHDENRNLMDPATLAQTVEDFNGYAQAGEDEAFGRRPDTLAPLDTSPFYAVPLYPGGPNTKGGILANAQRQAINWNNEPIPRLYTAGEISSTFKFVYQGGGNITECLVCGRIAGKNAAAEENWS